jgi:hypothetical protein
VTSGDLGTPLAAPRRAGDGAGGRAPLRRHRGAAFAAGLAAAPGVVWSARELALALTCSTYPGCGNDGGRLGIAGLVLALSAFVLLLAGVYGAGVVVVLTAVAVVVALAVEGFEVAAAAVLAGVLLQYVLSWRRPAADPVQPVVRDGQAGIATVTAVDGERLHVEVEPLDGSEPFAAVVADTAPYALAPGETYAVFYDPADPAGTCVVPTDVDCLADPSVRQIVDSVLDEPAGVPGGAPADPPSG